MAKTGLPNGCSDHLNVASVAPEERSDGYLHSTEKTRALKLMISMLSEEETKSSRQETVRCAGPGKRSCARDR
jgi:hypothetical protein